MASVPSAAAAPEAVVDKDMFLELSRSDKDGEIIFTSIIEHPILVEPGDRVVFEPEKDIPNYDIVLHATCVDNDVSIPLLASLFGIPPITLKQGKKDSVTKPIPVLKQVGVSVIRAPSAASTRSKDVTVVLPIAVATSYVAPFEGELAFATVHASKQAVEDGKKEICKNYDRQQGDTTTTDPTSEKPAKIRIRRCRARTVKVGTCK